MVPDLTVREVCVHPGDPGYAPIHHKLGKKLLVATALKSNISRTYIIKRISEELIHTSVMICYLRTTSCSWVCL